MNDISKATDVHEVDGVSKDANKVRAEELEKYLKLDELRRNEDSNSEKSEAGSNFETEEIEEDGMQITEEEKEERIENTKEEESISGASFEDKEDEEDDEDAGGRKLNKNHNLKAIMHQNDLLFFRLGQSEEREDSLQCELEALKMKSQNVIGLEEMKLKEKEWLQKRKERDEKKEQFEKALSAKTKQLIEHARRNG